MKEEMKFQTESKELLNLMINSIYSDHEVFLRELISNASDAIDKHRYLALNSEGKINLHDYEIKIELDEKKRTLTIKDNGIGMNKDDLINNLGTIAKSGSKDFVSKLKEAKEKQDLNIIGQFGVGFYSAFMVANQVSVLTKKEGEQAYLFNSDGVDGFTIEDASKEESGTEITLTLKKSKEVDFDKYLHQYEIKSLVKKYSDYIRYPIKMLCDKQIPEVDKDGNPIEGKYKDVKEVETLNSMIPLWKKNKKEVDEAQLNSFYKEKFMDYEDPFTSLFIKVDGLINYDALIYIPSHAPYNLYSENYEKGLQLYSRGVFIKDKCPELVPDYLKFIKGLVDSSEFSLNISREMLQQSPLLKKIADNIEKKVIDKLKEIKNEDIEKYGKFFDNFGEHLKYGIYSSYGAKKDLLIDTLIYHSLLNDDKYIDLKEYVKNKKKDQKYIYFASGENLDYIKMLPQIEKYKKEEIDVLLLDKRIDEFAIMMMRDYEKLEFKSISDDSNDDLDKEEKEKIESIKVDYKRLLDNIQEALKDEVSEVVISSKLVDSPVCLSTKDGLSLEMEKTLNEERNNEEAVKATKVLELNPEHELFKAFSSIQNDDEMVKKYASILYDEALLLEGREVNNKREFVNKLNELMIKAINK